MSSFIFEFSKSNALFAHIMDLKILDILKKNNKNRQGNIGE